jgi:hypothetical protein
MSSLPPLSPNTQAKMEQKKAAKEKKRGKAETATNKASGGGKGKSGDKGSEVI